MSNVSLVDGHIDEPKMTDEEIIKALECCMNKELNGDAGNLTCLDCPLCNCSMDCLSIKSKNALDLINRKDAEIDILKAEIERYKGVIRLLEKDIAEARTDGVKDFAKFLIDKGTELNTFDLCDYVPEFLERKEGE